MGGKLNVPLKRCGNVSTSLKIDYCRAYKTKPFGGLSACDVTVSVKRLFTEITTLPAASKPNNFDLIAA